MGTIVASRSSYLAQPGMPLVEPEEPLDTLSTVDVLPIVPYRATTVTEQESQRVREARWVCEWWPPE